MAELPQEITVGPYRLRVTVDEGELAKAEVRVKSELVGHADPDRGIVVLRTDQSPDSMVDTVLHELLHVVWRLVGLDQRQLSGIEEEDKLQEAVVAGMSTLLLDTLRRNPKLVAYLVA